MPRPNIRHFSAWEYLAPAVMRLLNREAKSTGPITIGSTHLQAVIVVALRPDTLGASLKIPEAGELARVFSEFYSEHPDLTLKLLAEIRKTWNNASIAAKVRKQCLTKIWLTRPQDKIAGVITTDAKDDAIRYAIDSRLKPKATEAVKKARQRLKGADRQLSITRALWAALRVLRERGFDVGDGM